jgi:sialate O-acetylesterase
MLLVDLLATVVSSSHVSFPSSPPPPPPAGLHFSPLFNNSMILQRSAATQLWGGGAPAGASVVVTVMHTISGKVLGGGTGMADGNGTWSLALHTPVAASPSTTVQVSSAGKTATLNDVAWGDVLLCGGQSNMGFGMCNVQSPTQNSSQALDAVAEAARSGFLRLFDMQGSNSPGDNGGCNTSSGLRSTTPNRRWFSPTAATAGGYSAVCLFTAMELLATNPTVPIGAVESCVGGTRIEAWTPSNWDPATKPGGPCAPGCLWHLYMVELVPFTFAAVYVCFPPFLPLSFSFQKHASRVSIC